MSYVVYDKLTTNPLDQDINIYEPKLIERVKLQLFKSLDPAGTFTLTILDSGLNILGTKSQTIAEMQAAGSAALSEDYYHGFISFIFDDPILLDYGVYSLLLSSSGYTPTATSFIGWMRDWDYKVTNNSGTTASDPSKQPLANKIFTYRRS